MNDSDVSPTEINTLLQNEYIEEMRAMRWVIYLEVWLSVAPARES